MFKIITRSYFKNLKSCLFPLRLSSNKFSFDRREYRQRPTKNYNNYVRNDDEESDFIHTNTVTFTNGSAELKDYQISAKTIERLGSRGIVKLRPVQITSFNHIYEGKNIIGKDRTGSGKTLAFAIPLIERYRKTGLFKQMKGQKPLQIVVVPTRELAVQLTSEYNKLKHFGAEYSVGCFYGGCSMYNQIQILKEGVEIVIGTPGRLLSLLDNSIMQLDSIQTVILDETDKMLDMGFQEPIEKIYSHLKGCLERAGRKDSEVQNLFFSATIPKWIKSISGTHLDNNFVFIDMIQGNPIKTSTTIEHYCIKIKNQYEQYTALPDIIDYFVKPNGQFIIFTDTKVQSQIVYDLNNLNYPKELFNGDVPQQKRNMVYKDFKANRLKCLVATDLASRGLDFPELDLIIILSPPASVDQFIHRSGRTGRADRKGVCITLYQSNQEDLVKNIALKAKINFINIDFPDLREELKNKIKIRPDN